jgi:hypothetical protein
MKALKWFLITIGLFLLCLPIVVSLFWEANKSGEVKSLQEPVEQPKDVAAEGSMSKTVLVEGDSLRLWITLRNRSGEDISNIRVSQLDVPGLEIKSLCSDGAGKNCSKPEDINIAQVAKGQTVVLWGDATATKKIEKNICYAMLSWTGSGGASSQLVIPLGGNVIETIWERRLHAMREFLKDFALPLLLVFLGLYVGQWDKEREAVRLAHEAETQQTHLTWISMLPETYKLAVRYYMKIEAGVAGVLQYIEKAHLGAQAPLNPKSTLLCRSSFFYIVLFQRRIKYFQDLNSGFYFKYRQAEDLVGTAYMRYRNLYLGDNEKAKRALNRIVEGADINETFDGFLTKLDGVAGVPTQDFADVWAHFLKWVPTESCRLAILELRVFDVVLGFEMNRPYSYWYGWDETLRYWAESQKTLEEVATELEKSEAEKPFAEAIRLYVKNGKPKP